MNYRQKILVVDDREENIVTLKKILAGIDADIVAATNGNDALAATLDHHFAMAILDVMMPTMNGYELAELLRSDSKTSVLPIVFLTASYPDEHHAFLGYEAGCVDYMTKPFSADILISKISIFLEMDRHRHELQEHRDHLDSLIRQRTKQIDTLYRISLLLAEIDVPVEQVFQGVAELIPQGWQDSRAACARIVFGQDEYSSPGYRKSSLMQTCDIVAAGKIMGTVEVCYPDDHVSPEGGPFVPEEWDLINQIAWILGESMERRLVQKQLQHSNRVLRSIRAVNQLMVSEKDLQRLLQGACDSLVQTRGFTGAWILLTENLPKSFECAHSGFSEEEFAPLRAMVEQGSIPLCCRRAGEQPDLVMHDRLEQTCRDCPFLASHLRHFAVVTIRLVYEGRHFGYLSLSAPSEFLFNAEEESLLKEIAGDIAFALYGLEAEMEKERLTGQLHQAQKMESIGRLAGGVAHDFNNLLTVILGYTEMVMEQLPGDTPMYGNLQQVMDASQSAADLTRQLLAFSRKQLISPQIIDINTTLVNSEKMLKRLLGEDLDLIFFPEDDLWKIKADPGQVNQVLMNLAVNARDAMPDGGKLSIETQNMTLSDKKCQSCMVPITGDFVMIAVSDTGTGITPQALEKIFEPFYTTKELNKGTGLGLSMVHGIVHQNGGHINVYSEPGVGTSFKIYLPRAGAESINYQETPEPESIGGSETVLLVEDMESVRKMAKSALEDHGYTVLEAVDGQEALAMGIAELANIDFILTDVVMPRLNGKLLCDKLQALKPGLKTLYMSGYTENAIAHQGVLDAGTDFIQKPFNQKDLARKVREILDRDTAAAGKG